MKKFDIKLYVEDRRKHGLSEEDIAKSVHVWGLKCDGKTVKPNKRGIYNISGTGFIAVPEWCREVA
jgi:hypothetical protein